MIYIDFIYYINIDYYLFILLYKLIYYTYIDFIDYRFLVLYEKLKEEMMQKGNTKTIRVCFHNHP